MTAGAPKITIRRQPPAIRPVTGLETTVWFAQGVTERGPVGDPQLITSWEEFKRVFGSFLSGYHLPVSMYRAMAGRGAKRFWVNRIVHFSDPDDVTTKTSLASTFTIQDQQTTPEDTLKVDAASDGAWGDDIDVQAAAATNKEANEFDLIVRYKDVEVERWRNMKIGSANANDPRYCETVINGNSDYIVVTDKESAGTPPENLPDTTEHPLAGGDDGLTTLADADYLGAAGLDIEREIADSVMNLLSPDITDGTSQKSLLDYCESERLFYIMDPPSGNDPETFVGALGTAGLIGYSELGEINYPWVKIVNPDSSVYGHSDTVLVPPGGGVAAAAISQDAKRGGVHEAYAGTENGLMADVVGLETDVVDDPNILDYLCSNNVNVIHRSRTGLFHLDNTDTLKVTESFPSIGESRGTLYIEKVLHASLEWVKNKNITQKLYRQIYDQIYLFLLGEMYNDAFASRDPDSAFYIDMNLVSLNPPSEQYAGRINIIIGLAKAVPARFINIIITKDVRAIAEELQK